MAKKRKNKYKGLFARSIINKKNGKVTVSANEFFDYDFSQVRGYVATITLKSGKEKTNIFTFPNEHETDGSVESFYRYVTEAVFPFVVQMSGATPATLKSFIVKDGNGVQLPGTFYFIKD